MAPSNRLIRSRKKNIIKQLPGARTATRNLKTPLEIWSYFINEDIFLLITENTNKYTQSLVNGYSRGRDPRSTAVNEICALIGLLYIAGTYRANHLNLEDLWASSGR